MASEEEKIPEGIPEAIPGLDGPHKLRVWVTEDQCRIHGDNARSCGDCDCKGSAQDVFTCNVQFPEEARAAILAAYDEHSCLRASCDGKIEETGLRAVFPIAIARAYHDAMKRLGISDETIAQVHTSANTTIGRLLPTDEAVADFRISLA